MGTKLLIIDHCEGNRQFLFEALELGGNAALRCRHRGRSSRRREREA